MAGASIIVDDRELSERLARLAAASADLTPLTADIAGIVLGSTQRRFETEMGPDGARWKPFAPSTLKRMSARRRADPKLLRDRNRLYSSLTAFSDATSAEVGTNVIYAALQQFGGEVTIPERQQESTFVNVKTGAGRKADGSRFGSTLRFARASTRARSKHTRSYTVPEHQITVPARAYLGIDETDRADILAAIEDHFGEIAR